MRNHTCTLLYIGKNGKEGTEAAGRECTSRAVPIDRSLAHEAAISTRRGGSADGVAAVSDDLHSLHLKTLIDEYLEPAAAGSLPAPSSLNRPFLPHLSNYDPFNLYNPSDHQNHKYLIFELQATLQNVGDNYGELRREIMKAMKKGDTHMNYMQSGGSNAFELMHVLVLEHLRKLGFNAGICKSQRDPQQKVSERCPFPAEEYEYLDVIQGEKGTQAHASERIIIDLRFKSQFEIARPSTAYMDLLKVVPTAYVGTQRVLQKVLRCLSEAMKRSLESQGMPLPPWRKLSFLQSKWLSPYYSRSIVAPPLPKLKHIINKASTKGENSLVYSTHKSPSNFTQNRDSSNCIFDNSPTYGVSKPPPLVDNKHKATTRENSHSITNYPLPPLPRPPILVDSKRILKSYNSSSHTLRTSSTKLSSIQSGEPMKVPWQLPPLSNPPSSLKQSRRLVGALTLALRSA